VGREPIIGDAESPDHEPHCPRGDSLRRCSRDRWPQIAAGEIASSPVGLRSRAGDRGHRGVDPYILVARSTDPAWTPLFLTAGAIVVEEGGPLSHAAIIARELGLPAVLNVPGFLALLDGATTVTLRVDGDHGTVEILDDIPTSNPARGEVFAS
jgi:phosphoenolpyruvate synthase/pyruvate phosphate dikinase